MIAPHWQNEWINFVGCMVLSITLCAAYWWWLMALKLDDPYPWFDGCFIVTMLVLLAFGVVVLIWDLLTSKGNPLP